MDILKFLLLFCLGRTRGEGYTFVSCGDGFVLMTVNGALSKKEAKADEFTDEHEHCLQVWVRKNAGSIMRRFR
jgi:hypothetical protein